MHEHLSTLVAPFQHYHHSPREFGDVINVSPPDSAVNQFNCERQDPIWSEALRATILGYQRSTSPKPHHPRRIHAVTTQHLVLPGRGLFVQHTIVQSWIHKIKSESWKSHHPHFCRYLICCGSRCYTATRQETIHPEYSSKIQYRL